MKVARIAPYELPGVVDARGYVRIWLGKGHRFAQKSGQQWRHRYVAMVELGRRLRPDEHVHHVNGKKSDDRPENLEILLAEFHGSLHCALTPIGRAFLQHGGGYRLRELDMPAETFAGFRRGPVIQVSSPRRGSACAA